MKFAPRFRAGVSAFSAATLATAWLSAAGQPPLSSVDFAAAASAPTGPTQTALDS